MRPRRHAKLIALLSFVFFFLCLLPVRSSNSVAQEKSLSEKSSRLKNVKPKQLEYTKWTKSLNVPDPIAISFDNQGRAYVTQTTRRKSNDLDIRNNRDWIPHDLSFQSVDEKINFYRERLSPENSKQNKRRVQDLNGDGKNDYRDLMVLSEKIFRIEDSNGDGFADSSKLFADGFNTEVTGIAAGVLHFDGEVYATIAPDVWKLQDTSGDGVANQRSKLVSGFGLHIAYAGHDMHGLTVGPDGKVYWSIGDKGVSVSSNEGKKFLYPNQGCVLRCNPDGSCFEVFAHGLRNVQELAFDQYGNLFGVDNDADQPGERERYVYIVPGMDAGWRCNYQYRGNRFNPWTDERLWQTYHSGQPAYIIPPLKYGPNGPAGFAFNPGTAINNEYKNYFFFTGAPHGDQFAFKVEPDGATFQVIDEHRIGRGVAIVGINFGPDGALYGVDWANGYPLNQTGAIWKIDDPNSSNSKIRMETKQLLFGGFEKLKNEKLSLLLGHADQRVRFGAQFELVKRNEISILHEVAAQVGNPQLRRIHAIWGLGQIDDQQSRPMNWAAFACDKDSEIQVQTLKVISDLKNFRRSEELERVFNSSNRRVQFHVMLMLRSHGSKFRDRWGFLERIASEIEMSNTYLRHAISMAMVGLNVADKVEEILASESEVFRICGVVALRSLKSEQVKEFLKDKSESVRAEAARAIHDDFSIPNALPDLAVSLNAPIKNGESFVRRAINANFRLGKNENILQLTRFATNVNQSLKFRKIAIENVGNWLTEDPLDQVTGRFQKLDTTMRILDKSTMEVVANRLGEIASGNQAELISSSLKAVRSLKVELNEKFLNAIVFSAKSPSEAKIEALVSLNKFKSSMLHGAIRHALKSSDEGLFLTSLGLFETSEPAEAFAIWKRKYEATDDMRWKQILLKFAADFDSQQKKQFILKEFELTLEHLDSHPLALDLLQIVSAESKKNEAAMTLLKEYHALVGEREKDNALFKYAVTLNGGNVERGKSIFNTNIDAQCVRCHRVGKSGSDVGPKLDGIATKRDANHLLRAIVFPSADIEPEYKTMMVALDSGKLINGVKVKETNDFLTIADHQGKTIKLNKDEIEQIAEKKQSIMPEMTMSLSMPEIRDLLAYLKSLN